MTHKLIREGQVAVLISPNFGAGWSTWADEYSEQAMFDSWIADVLLNERFDHKEKIDRIMAHCNLKYPDMYLGGLNDLVVQWVPMGTAFRITEYDGSETIEFRDQIAWITA